MATTVLTCEQFGSFLARRTEHIDNDILQDWFPNDDAWLGHIATGAFPAFQGGGTGYEHTWWRFHTAFPDLAEPWNEVVSASCSGSPCDPDETQIGYGTTATTYKLLKKSFTSALICWDQAVQIDMAKEQYAQYVAGLKESSKIISSDRFKTEALRKSGTLYLAGAANTSVTPTFTETSGQPMVMDTGGVYPTSTLTMPYLMLQEQPLQMNGYFKKMFSDRPVFKLITDLQTSYGLREGNPALASLFRFDDFNKGGALYKLGASSGVGNFVIPLDQMPIRFNKRASDGKLVRVYPYTNTSATTGIKRTVSTQYINAEFQWSPIWHPEAMRILTFQGEAVHPEMPFLVRSMMGTWKFAMDNLVVEGCPVDNKRRNKGLWFADFQNASRMERPEIVRGILHLCKNICAADVAACAAGSAYEAQTTSSANAICTQASVLTFTPQANGAGNYVLNANTVLMNGVAIVHIAVSEATLAALATTLGTALPAGLGTWAVSGSNITLTGCNCASVTLPWVV